VYESNYLHNSDYERNTVVTKVTSDSFYVALASLYFSKQIFLFTFCDKKEAGHCLSIAAGPLTCRMISTRLLRRGRQRA
jgi:hypothetical protein